MNELLSFGRSGCAPRLVCPRCNGLCCWRWRPWRAMLQRHTGLPKVVATLAWAPWRAPVSAAHCGRCRALPVLLDWR